MLIAGASRGNVVLFVTMLNIFTIMVCCME